MASLVAPRPQVKASRSVRVLLPLRGNSAGVIRLAVGRQHADYLVRKLASDFGDAFRLSKVGVFGDTSEYDINLSAEGQTCECRGFLRHGHCKHVDGLKALRVAGQL
jgi:hypothetical protein